MADKQKQSPPLPALIDSGASGTVFGWSWIQSWIGRREISLTPSLRIVRFGDGRLIPRLGECDATLYLQPQHTSASIPETVAVTVDVVPSIAHVPISKQSLESTQGKLDFAKATLGIATGLTVCLKNLAIAHISLPAPLKLKYILAIEPPRRPATEGRPSLPLGIVTNCSPSPTTNWRRFKAHCSTQCNILAPAY